jgi:hypothetical protein
MIGKSITKDTLAKQIFTALGTPNNGEFAELSCLCVIIDYIRKVLFAEYLRIYDPFFTFLVAGQE